MNDDCATVALCLQSATCKQIASLTLLPQRLTLSLFLSVLRKALTLPLKEACRIFKWVTKQTRFVVQQQLTLCSLSAFLIISSFQTSTIVLSHDGETCLSASIRLSSWWIIIFNSFVAEVSFFSFDKRVLLLLSYHTKVLCRCVCIFFFLLVWHI